MREWWMANWGNVLVLGVIALAVGAIVLCSIRARKMGKSGCARGCAGCAMQGVCHENKQKKI